MPLKPEQRQLIEDNMGDNPCIVCVNTHPEKGGKMHAWLCTQANGPISTMSWIGKNFPLAQRREARAYVFQLKRLGNIPSQTPTQPVASPVAPPGDEAPSDQVPESTESGEGQDAQTPAPSAATAPAITQQQKDQELAAVNRKMDSLKHGETPILSQYPVRTKSCATIQDAVHTTVKTNFFKIDIDPKTVFYEYQILDLPIGQNKKKLEKLVRALIDRMNILKSNKDHFTTDNITTIISWKKLHKKEEVGDIIDTCDLLRVLDFSKLSEYVGGSMVNPHLWDSSIEVKALNMLISKSLKDQQVIRMGANKFFVKNEERYLSDSLTMMQGYFYTIKPLDAGILLNVSYGTSAFYQSQTVEKFLQDEKTFRPEKSRWAALNALRAQISYGRGKTPKGREDDRNNSEGRQKTIAGTSLKDLTFEKKAANGSKFNKNVLEYLQESYPDEFKEEKGNLPGINLGTPRDKEWFAPAKLKILPHQIYRRPIPDILIDKMLKRAAMIPHDGVHLIDKAGCEPLTVVPKLLQIDSTILRYPSIIYGGHKKIDLYNQSKKNGGSGETPRWTLKNCNFLESGPTAGACVNVYLLATEKIAAFETALKEALGTYNIADSKNNKRYGLTPQKVLASLGDAELRRALHEVKLTSSGPRKKIVLLLLRNSNRTIYQSFKDLADREFGLQTVCITQEKVCDKGTGALARGYEQYLGNVMMKVNLKCGGINHSAGDSAKNSNESLQTKLGDVMILGTDVTHPSVASIEGCPSIASIVGSVDGFGGKFLGSMRLQNPDRTDREIIQEVESMVEERLRAYWNYPVKPTNSTIPKPRERLPKKTMYYRDGVSEGQSGKSIREEVSAIRRAFEKVKKEKKWKEDMKLTSIVVTKRHHTRFYPTRDQDAEGKPKNCKPGTVVDTSVTSPYFKEFFLQSHSGLQGTTKPAHYFVIQDDAEWDVADLTHQLSYTYVRASCGVSYAPPTYYADRLCERGRIYLRSFLNGNSSALDTINNKKTAMEAEQRTLREAISKPAKEQKKQDTRVWPAKTKEEEVMELLHKDQVSKMCKGLALEEASKVWDDTMFWM
ncbi:hypothetical protein ACET3X_003422 [Alternaria dauci]|uniref:Piwi domain-containing protein n=1 Tax=Alternaria dauci TaxID=48095 RepID=A0ABR3UTI1_9PLEO